MPGSSSAVARANAALTATEMLGGLLGKPASQIDLPFAAWMTGHGLAGLTESDDSDGDGVPAAVEFALGLNRTLRAVTRTCSRGWQRLWDEAWLCGPGILTTTCPTR